MNNDLISREALKEVITANHYLLSNRNNSIDYGMFTTGIMQAIDNAPTVDIKDEIAGAYNEGYMCGNKEAEKGRPQGEWVFRSGGYYKCSNCGEVERAEKKYCPNCGVKMRKGGTEE